MPTERANNMTRKTVRNLHVRGVFLAVAATMGCAGSADGGGESTGTAEQKEIRAPVQAYLNDELNAAGIAKTTVDPSRDFDTRRDVWEDEAIKYGPDDIHPRTAFGQDPDKWNQTTAASQATHNGRLQRMYGFQWLRSYARNASFAFFHKDDLVDLGNGWYRPKHQTEVDDAQLADALQAKRNSGRELCDDQRFAAQMNGGYSGRALCSGVLIDKDLMLTAAHCLRNGDAPVWGPGDYDPFKLNQRRRIGQTTAADIPISDLRVALNYTAAYPGQGTPWYDPDQPGRNEILFKKGRDVFRIREVVTLNRKYVDAAVVQLLDEDGNEISGVDPMYAPVPLWESGSPPPVADSWSDTPISRAVASIGVSEGLPQKISIGRAPGWFTDSAFLGIDATLDNFHGNSGGGLYDVETGALLGVVNFMYSPTISYQCPTDVSASRWPECLSWDRVNYPDKTFTMDLATVPDFSINGTTATPKNCWKWGFQGVTSTAQIGVIRDYLKNQWGLLNVTVSPPPLGNNSTYATTVHAFRRLLCQPAASVDEYKQLVSSEAYNAYRDAYDLDQIDSSGRHSCYKDRNLPEDQTDAYAHCPSGRVVSNLSFDNYPILVTGAGDPSGKLLSSRLCLGTLPAPVANTWSQVRQLALEPGRELTLHGTTLAEPDYFSSVMDVGSSVPDALYAIQVGDSPMLLYADTFSGGADLADDVNPGTNFDTSLYMMKATSTDSDPAIDDSHWAAARPFTDTYPLPDPFDDSRCGPDTKGLTSGQKLDVDFYYQSQMVEYLEPNTKYLLVVSGGAGGQFANPNPYSVGNYNLHLQTVPAPRSGNLALAQYGVDALLASDPGTIYMDFKNDQFITPPMGDGAAQCGAGATAWTCVFNTVPKNVCQAEDTGDFGLIAASCPLFRGGNFRFRVNDFTAVNTTADAVGSFWEGNNLHSMDGYVCSDDSWARIHSYQNQYFRVLTFSSEIGNVSVDDDSPHSPLTGGAGIKGFYAHQFKRGLDWTKLGYELTIPPDASNNCWRSPLG
jgi:hypothetical protein